MFDISGEMYIIRSAIVEAAAFSSAPHVRMRPSIYPDGDQWCCLLGDDLQVGICGFGETPELACAAFDKAFSAQRTPAACIATAESRGRKDCGRYEDCETGICQCHCLDAALTDREG